MKIILKKLDMSVDLKMDAVTKEQESRQNTFEAKLDKKVMDLKREFRNIQLKRDIFYKQTMEVKNGGQSSERSEKSAPRKKEEFPSKHLASSAR